MRNNDFQQITLTSYSPCRRSTTVSVQCYLFVNEVNELALTQYLSICVLPFVHFNLHAIVLDSRATWQRSKRPPQLLCKIVSVCNIKNRSHVSPNSRSRRSYRFDQFCVFVIVLHVWLFGSLPEADKESILAGTEEKYIHSRTPLP